MEWPGRFPFDVLDPAPLHCLNCSCLLAEAPQVQGDCQFPACDCHILWMDETDESYRRWKWGDK